MGLIEFSRSGPNGFKIAAACGTPVPVSVNLLTECSMADNVAAENPDKEMLRLCSVRCPHMNQITLQDTLDSLLRNRYVVDVPEEIRLKAKRAVDRMLQIH